MNEHTAHDVNDDEPEVEGFTDALRLLAQVAHNQAQDAGEDLSEIAGTQQENLAQKPRVRSMLPGLSFNHNETKR